MSVVCYAATGKRKAPALCGAFAIGAGGGSVLPDSAPTLLSDHAFIFGSSSANFGRIDWFKGLGPDVPWYYGDGAYGFGRGEFFRITRGALQVDGVSGRGDSARWRRFGLDVKPWRRDGAQIVVATQSDAWHQWTSGMSAAAWGAHVAARIRAHTDRRIVVCALKGEYPFAEALRSAWAVVVHSSSAAIAAQIEGVPTFCLEECAASIVSRYDLQFIESPSYPDDREPWLHRLAAAQWTLDEIRDGIAWRALQA